MFIKQKAVPLQAREAMGFRGARKVRSCFKCGVTEDNNYDEFGKLQQLKVVSRDKNLYNTRANNHYFICNKCRS